MEKQSTRTTSPPSSTLTTLPVLVSTSSFVPAAYVSTAPLPQYPKNSNMYTPTTSPQKFTAGMTLLSNAANFQQQHQQQTHNYYQQQHASQPQEYTPMTTPNLNIFSSVSQNEIDHFVKSLQAHGQVQQQSSSSRPVNQYQEQLGYYQMAVPIPQHEQDSELEQAAKD
ncbi:hypothetical protein HDU76_006706, partial [Blyttiomyces sp. JEL0837]